MHIESGITSGVVVVILLSRKNKMLAQIID